ncbi:undecaprenyl diphosphate synthase family protein [Nocardioides panzhihuensis]|uniref:Undecaprenyl pyrophosphate synthase n=1 Tax=Nocardioides panzhihuensis TaxID=860243 RepID=A0A7Z0IT68_9ACTN|nr:undecaprenyl diphosphate synthase family protein [Nocardioides panzhihuensis]NYI78636.1 undecaprenyl pyrophosphate synthase [Nocardioides panzhihuensis]
MPETAETIAPHLLPRHVGMVMDGNRRWAKKAGFSNPGAGHDVGADRRPAGTPHDGDRL